MRVSASIGNVAATYIIIFTILGVFGTLAAKTAEYIGCSQYACNFVYGVVIAIYAMENWILSIDLLRNHEIPDPGDETVNIAIIKGLVSENNKLTLDLLKMNETLAISKTAKKLLKNKERAEEAVDI